MKRILLIFVLIAITHFALTQFSWASCPQDQDPQDQGAADTLHPIFWTPQPGDFPKEVYVSLLVTNDYDVGAFCIPLTWWSSNPAASCSLPAWANSKSFTNPYSVFRDFGGMSNRMRELGWHTRIIDVSNSHFWMCLVPTDTSDFPWNPGYRTLLATLTFIIYDTTTICIDTTFWPPASNISFARTDAMTYVPRHNMPICSSDSTCGDLMFRPNPDGWGFANVDTNMWPQVWWQERFNYCGDQYPLDWCSTCKSSDFPDWPLFVSAFGENQCYWPGHSGRKGYKKKAVALWFAIKSALGGKWRGSCFGFAISSFLFFDGYLDVSTVFGYTQLYLVPITNESRLLINKYWLYQFGSNQLQYIHDNWDSTSPNQTLQACQNMFKTRVHNDRILLLYDCQLGECGGHAVNPYRCELDVANNENTRVYIYDNKYPGDDSKYLSINTDTNSWTYSDLDWGGSRQLFLSDCISNDTTNPILPRDTSELYFYISPADYVLFESTAGSIGHIGDSVFSTLSDATPIIPIGGYPTPPIGYNLPNNVWRCNFSGIADSTFRLSLFSDYTVMVYWRTGATSTQTENIRYQDNDSTLLIFNPDSESRFYNLDAICPATDSEIFYRIEDISIDHSDSTCYSIKPQSELQLDNYGETKTYKLRIQIAGTNFDTTFFHEGIILKGNCSHLVIPDWRHYNDSLMILIDSGMVGSFSDTIYVQNQGESRRGDANGDGVVDVGDVVFLINYLFKSGQAPNPLGRGDTNCDNVLDVGDVVYLINYLFKNGPPPPC